MTEGAWHAKESPRRRRALWGTGVTVTATQEKRNFLGNFIFEEAPPEAPPSDHCDALLRARRAVRCSKICAGCLAGKVLEASDG